MMVKVEGIFARHNGNDHLVYKSNLAIPPIIAVYVDTMLLDANSYTNGGLQKAERELRIPGKEVKLVNLCNIRNADHYYTNDFIKSGTVEDDAPLSRLIDHIRCFDYTKTKYRIWGDILREYNEKLQLENRMLL